jgi:molecular chaperone HtpG
VEAKMANETKKGNISVETSHIFPIIKKWLYSEKEIFIRELVSNATDAITKMKRLSSLGQIEAPTEPYKITVSFNKSAKTISISDNGIGMTEDELDRYICKMALSGAMEFIEKYEGKDTSGNGIIGHFGLGFYSAFMVADRVELFTKSYTDAEAVHWDCDSESEYTTEATERERGTTVIMHINEDGEEYLSEHRLREILDRYCAFMPVEIYLEDEEKDGEDEKSAPINDTNPLWQKSPSDCTDEEYKAFYTKVFSDYREPLFYMHISADYPLNFKGVLYFPRLRENYESLEGKIKLYYNQVFVADNIKEVIPEYLLMLRGVLDCPELPLNVSRSYLQNSGYVTKISAHIVKKVADKLNSMFNNDRQKFEEIWKELRTFVEYGCICDKKFYERVSPSVLIGLVGGEKKTIDEYLTECKEKHENIIYYATDEKLQSRYISMYQAKGISVALLDGALDVRFTETVEQNKENVKFKRVDSDLSALKDEGDSCDDASMTELFKKVSSSDTLDVKLDSFTDARVPALLSVNEEMLRMNEMMKMYAPDMPEQPVQMTLSLNKNNAIIKRLQDGSYGENAEKVAKQIYSLSLLSQKKLSAEEMESFFDNSCELLTLI